MVAAWCSVGKLQPCLATAANSHAACCSHAAYQQKRANPQACCVIHPSRGLRGEEGAAAALPFLYPAPCPPCRAQNGQLRFRIDKAAFCRRAYSTSSGGAGWSLIGGAVRSLVQQQWVCVTNKKGLRGGTAPKPLSQQLLEGCLHHVHKRSLMTAQQRRPWCTTAQADDQAAAAHGAAQTVVIRCALALEWCVPSQQQHAVMQAVGSEGDAS